MNKIESSTSLCNLDRMWPDNWKLGNTQFHLECITLFQLSISLKFLENRGCQAMGKYTKQHQRHKRQKNILMSALRNIWLIPMNIKLTYVVIININITIVGIIMINFVFWLLILFSVNIYFFPLFSYFSSLWFESTLKNQKIYILLENVIITNKNGVVLSGVPLVN